MRYLIRNSKRLTGTPECVRSNGQIIYSPTWYGGFRCYDGKSMIGTNTGFWNCSFHSFYNGEPPLKICFGVPLISKRRVESKGFSGPLLETGESVEGQKAFSIAGTTWIHHEVLNETHFEVVAPNTELRAITVGFCIHGICQPRTD